MKKTAAVLAAALLALGAGAPAAAAAPPPAVAASAASGHGCGARWGTSDKAGPTLSAATVSDVRASRHGCFDQLVIDLHGGVAGYSVRYVDQVLAEGSGRPIPLRGGAFLEVSVTAPAYDVDGNPTYFPANPAEVVSVSGFDAFRQVAWGASFEGHTRFGLGVRERLPFRVFILKGPDHGSRLVIEVAHR